MFFVTFSHSSCHLFFLALTVCINIHIFTSSPFHEKQKLLHHTRRARVSQNKIFANKVQVKEWGSKKEKIWNKTYTKVRKKHFTSVWLGVCVCEWGKKKSCSKFDSRWRDEQTNWTIQVSLPLKEKELSLPTRVRMWFWWLVVVVAMGGRVKSSDWNGSLFLNVDKSVCVINHEFLMQKIDDQKRRKEKFQVLNGSIYQISSSASVLIL
jgi:hypothetical protein